MSYNKNVNNQSGLSVDNINVNTLATLPKSTIIDSVNGLIFSGGSSFSSVVVANGGIQLPSTSYTTAANYLGYQPTVNLQNNRLVIPGGIVNNMGSVTLTPGTYIVRGQIEIFAYLSTSINENKLSLSTDGTMNNSIAYAYTNTNPNILGLGVTLSLIQEVTGLITVSVPTTYYLISNINFSSGGGVIIRTKNVTVSITTINTSQSGTNILMTAFDSTVTTGMKVTGTGIVQNCYVISFSSGTAALGISTTQTIAANTVLTLSHSNVATNLIAVRIA